MRSSQRRQVGNEGDQNNFGQGRGKETKINLTSGVYLDVCNWRAPRLATNDADGDLVPKSEKLHRRRVLSPSDLICGYDSG